MDTCAFGPKESLVDSRWYLVKEILMSWLDGKTVKRLNGETVKSGRFALTLPANDLIN